jgi:LmbE family N-acetylglucosaminyl deacetylase
MAPFVSAQTRLLVVAPHPDDETLGAGLLIQRVLAAGGAVKLLLLTNGDNNPWPQRYVERRFRIDDAARQRWGNRRRAEVLRAIDRLGLSPSALEVFDWPDMGLTQRLAEDTQSSIAAIANVLETFQPTIVVFPALEDSHPDHGAAHVLCRLALTGWLPVPTMLAFPVHMGASVSDYPVLSVGSDAQLRHKLDALSQYHSQMALSGRRMRRMALHAERFQEPVEPSMAANDRVLPWRPSVLLRPWLRLLVATPAGVTDWPWSRAPLARHESGAYRLELPAGQVASPCFAKLHLDWPSLWIFDHWGWCAL